MWLVYLSIILLSLSMIKEIKLGILLLIIIAMMFTVGFPMSIIYLGIIMFIIGLLLNFFMTIILILGIVSGIILIALLILSII